MVRLTVLLLGALMLLPASALFAGDCDFEVNGVYGSPAGGATISTTIVKEGACSWDFTANGARAIFPSTFFNQQTGRIEAWVYPTSGAVDPTTNNSGIFWDKSNSGGLDDGGFRVAFNYPRSWVSVQIDDDQTHANLVYFNCAIPLNQWTHIAVFWNGSRVWLYKDFVEAGNAALNAFPHGTDRCSMGAAQDGGGDFDGYMDDVRFSLKAHYDAAVELDPNVLNTRSNGNFVTCYLEAGAVQWEDFDQILLEGEVSALDEFRTIGDYNANGIPDLEVKFSRQAVLNWIESEYGEDLTTFGRIDLEILASAENEEAIVSGKGALTVIAPPRGRREETFATDTKGPGISSIAPNPFNPSTTIGFNVIESSYVSLVIYDVGGRTVRTLVATRMEPGEHSVVWDGRNDRGDVVRSGIYFCRMNIGTRAFTKKMALLR